MQDWSSGYSQSARLPIVRPGKAPQLLGELASQGFEPRWPFSQRKVVPARFKADCGIQRER